MVFNFQVEIARHGYHEAPQWIDVTINQDQQLYESGMDKINGELDMWDNEQYHQWCLAKQNLLWSLRDKARERAIEVVNKDYPEHYILTLIP